MNYHRALFSKYKYIAGGKKKYSPVKASVDVWRFTNSKTGTNSEDRLEEIANILFDEWFEDVRVIGDTGTGFSFDVDTPSMMLNVKYEYEVYTIGETGERNVLAEGVKQWFQNP